VLNFFELNFFFLRLKACNELEECEGKGMVREEGLCQFGYPHPYTRGKNWHDPTLRCLLWHKLIGGNIFPPPAVRRKFGVLSSFIDQREFFY
jgi:hypothetical protein